MRSGFLMILVLLICIGAYLYKNDPHTAMKVVNGARAFYLSLTPAHGDAPTFTERFKANYADFADRERQEKWTAAYGHIPGGMMIRFVMLPSDLPDRQAAAEQICQNLLAQGFVQDIEDKFPSINRTNKHSISLSAQNLQQANVQVTILFSYEGFIHRGDPRKIVDYGESIVRKEVAAKYASVSTFDSSPPSTIDVSETAIITDLPDEGQTANAIAKMAQTTPSE